MSTSVVPTVVTLVWRGGVSRGGVTPPPPLLLRFTAILMHPWGQGRYKHRASLLSTSWTPSTIRSPLKLPLMPTCCRTPDMSSKLMTLETTK